MLLNDKAAPDPSSPEAYPVGLTNRPRSGRLEVGRRARGRLAPAQVTYGSTDMAYRKGKQKKLMQEAHHAVARAVGVGRLPHISTLLCTRCTKPARLYHHYAGYSVLHQLSVIAVCSACHKHLHAPRMTA